MLRRERWRSPASFVIESHSKGRDGTNHESFQRYWYAPALGTVVKYGLKI